ncbi:unnamed protein product [Auanema sp. JU1783]|nr:unnamed protein product [Auanema sp. JU1783]
MDNSGQYPTPPPLPPRPFESYNYGSVLNGGYMGMPNTAMGYNQDLGNIGMYRNGMYPTMPYGGYGMSRDTTFARLAEESSRGAFESIESVVNAVTSVANMLSSTHNAVYSSFRAVIGVVEQFSRLKMQVSSAVLSLALFKFIIKLWKKFLVFLKLKPQNYASVVEEAWGDSQQPFGVDILGSDRSQSISWPTVLFWTVALGGPYVIYKFIDQMVKTVEEKRKWATGSGDHYTAETLFPFQASNEQELSFMKGDLLRIAPKEEQPRVRGWLLASTQDGSKIGVVPINYVKVIGHKTKTPPSKQMDNFAKFDSAFK